MCPLIIVIEASKLKRENSYKGIPNQLKNNLVDDARRFKSIKLTSGLLNGRTNSWTKDLKMRLYFSEIVLRTPIMVAEKQKYQ